MDITKKVKNEFKGKIILITGGTGSIGLSIVKKLLKCNPQAIRILSNDENSIFESKWILNNHKLVTFMVGDVRDQDRLRLAIRDVDIVFHAAAMKHVDICEQNPFDAVKTNVIGTSNILEASLIENISKFILISTDKATDPRSILGTSKLLAERLTHDASSYRGRSKTIFSIVRFGNVIGSRGSVFQIFLNQIKNGGPITVTDPRMTRFIMSVYNASNMILTVTSITQDKEIFILKMPSIRIEDLAKGMKDICGKKLKSNNIKIKFSKIREGERLHEYLISNNELSYCYDIGNMIKISHKRNPKLIDDSQLSSETAKRISKNELKKIINETLNEFTTSIF